jgi:hypothetical protein
MRNCWNGPILGPRGTVRDILGPLGRRAVIRRVEPRQFVADRLAVGLVGIVRDDSTARLCASGRERRQRSTRRGLGTSDHREDAPTIEVGDDRGKPATAAVVGLVERQPPGGRASPRAAVRRASFRSALTTGTTFTFAAGPQVHIAKER